MLKIKHDLLSRKDRLLWPSRECSGSSINGSFHLRLSGDWCSRYYFICGLYKNTWIMLEESSESSYPRKQNGTIWVRHHRKLIFKTHLLTGSWMSIHSLAWDSTNWPLINNLVVDCKWKRLKLSNYHKKSRRWFFYSFGSSSINNYTNYCEKNSQWPRLWEIR